MSETVAEGCDEKPVVEYIVEAKQMKQKIAELEAIDMEARERIRKREQIIDRLEARIAELEKHNRFLEDTLTKKAKHMEDTVGSLKAKIAELEEWNEHYVNIVEDYIEKEATWRLITCAHQFEDRELGVCTRCGIGKYWHNNEIDKAQKRIATLTEALEKAFVRMDEYPNFDHRGAEAVRVALQATKEGE